MDKNVKSQLMVAGAAVAIVAALIGAGLYLNNFFDESEQNFVEQKQPKFETADETKTIPKADSDFYDRNGDGVYEEGLDIPTPDGLSDIEEIYQYGTDVTNPDTDGDGMEDGWEAFFSVDPKTNKWRVNPRTGRLAIDPNFKDMNEDPDNDGFDANGDGRYQSDENLTNLKEYCGGRIFEGYNPFDGVNDDSDLRYIRSHGGFHLAWKLENDKEPTSPINFKTDWNPEYNPIEYGILYDNKYYNSYNPFKDPLVTTDPTDRDTDNDRMYDGWELHFQNLTRYYSEIYGIYFNETLDPMDDSDKKGDMDVRKTPSTIRGLEPEEVYEPYPDGLTNLQEFENNTNPVLWDTDDDTFYDPGQDRIFEWDDRTELDQTESSCPDRPSNTDWNRDGIYDVITNPNDPDTDGDFMSDGFEIFYGLCPLNSSDRFLDLDGDGLANYLEYRFPEVGNRWFRTDPNDKDTDDDGIPDGWEAKNAKVIEEYWWTFDSDGEEIMVVYEYGRQHHIEEGVKYMRKTNQDLDVSDGILDRHWYNFTVNPMVNDSAQDKDGYWYDDPDNVPDPIRNILVEEDGDNDTIPDYHWVKDNLTNTLEWAGTANFTGDYFDGLTDPNDPDTDGDGLLDGQELLEPVRGELISGKWFTTEIAEHYYYTNPNLADSDQDFDPNNLSRTLDDWEEINGRTHEGYDFAAKYDTFSGINAISPDTDLDGMNDVDEVFGVDTGEYEPDDITSGFGYVRTNPGNRDTDSDGAFDADEIVRLGNYRQYITDPNNPDTDGDLLKDGDELKIDYFPFIDYIEWDNYDANGDDDYTDTDLGDIWSKDDRTNPRAFDTDHDGMPDGWEGANGGTTDLRLIGNWIKTHPTSSYATVLVRHLDTNGDLIVDISDKQPEVRIYLVNPLDPNDKYEDPDSDGLNNWEEYLNNTNPLRWDTDGDLLPDGWEILYSKKNLDPTRPDTDADDEPDDEDGDGDYSSVEEILNGLDDDFDGLIDEEYDQNDANEDFDNDGMFYYMFVKQPDNSWKYTQFYHPFTTYYEYYWGWSNDEDDYHEVTTNPNEMDSDGDRMPDGWEIWVSDQPTDTYNRTIYDDQDGLAKGWEDMFNGSMGIFPSDFVPNILKLPAVDQAVYRNKFDSTKFNTDGQKADNDQNKMSLDKNNDGHVDDGEEDPDGDGANNTIEYRYHTDPTDKNSNPTAAGVPIHKTRGDDTEETDDPEKDTIDEIEYVVELYNPDVNDKITDYKEANIIITIYEIPPQSQRHRIFQI